jgi:RNA polymerase sigma-70 factor (ECF subfamily)
MSDSLHTDQLLIQRIRQGDAPAWGDLIARYEGRLLAFVEGRVGRRAVAEDIVQEIFVGFLNSLPNYDGRRPLESYLFSICAYKLTDHLRREGRRPAISLSARGDSDGSWDLPDTARAASSIARSVERRDLEEKALAEAIQQQVAHLRERAEWTKLKCLELLFLGGWANKDVAKRLRITEQQVANFKFDFIARLRKLVGQQGLPSAVFPELQQDD